MPPTKRTTSGHRSVHKMREEWLLKRISDLETKIEKVIQERDRLRNALQQLAEFVKTKSSLP